MANKYNDYELWFGTFEGEIFKWKVLNKFTNFNDAYTAYKKFVLKQMSYTNDELAEVWGSGRIDIELKKGKKKLNWVGIYSREVNKEELLEEDEDE